MTNSGARWIWLRDDWAKRKAGAHDRYASLLQLLEALTDDSCPYHFAPAAFRYGLLTGGVTATTRTPANCCSYVSARRDLLSVATALASRRGTHQDAAARAPASRKPRHGDGATQADARRRGSVASCSEARGDRRCRRSSTRR